MIQYSEFVGTDCQRWLAVLTDSNIFALYHWGAQCAVQNQIKLTVIKSIFSEQLLCGCSVF